MAPRIVVASLLAFLVGSFLNAYVMSKMKVASGGRNFSARAIWSTVVGETADSLIFFPIAFGGLIAWPELLVMMGTQIVLICHLATIWDCCSVDSLETETPKEITNMFDSIRKLNKQDTV